MDSGIDSTESSNGSTSEASAIMTDVQVEETQNSETQKEDFQCPSQDNFKEPYCLTPGYLLNKMINKEMSKITEERDNIESNYISEASANMTDIQTEEKKNSETQKDDIQRQSQDNFKEPYSLPPGYLLDKIINKEISKITEEGDSIESNYMCSSALDSFRRSIYKSISDNVADNMMAYPKASSPVSGPEVSPGFIAPEGCCLKLNFPKIRTDTTSFEEHTTPLETILPLSFANGTLQISTNPQPYTGSLAVLPYESRDLQRKFKHYRKRLSQIISTKPKEKKLRISASLNNEEQVERLLKEGVNPKATDEKQRTALHIAASKGYTNIARLLLQNGADPNQKDSIGNTALHLAACTSHIETVTLLLKAGTNVKQADNQGYSPLHLANSRLKFLQRDLNPSSQSLRHQVYQIVEMMQAYLKCSGNTEDAELLTALTTKLTLTDTSTAPEADIKQLLLSLQDLTLSKTKKE